MGNILANTWRKNLEAKSWAMQSSEASFPLQGKPNTGIEAVGRGAHHASEASNGVGTRSVQGCPLVNDNSANFYMGHPLNNGWIVRLAI